MFRSDFLNNHPIMLEYLAAGVLKGDSESSDRGDEDVGGDSAAAAPKKSGARKSFVDRLRGNRARKLASSELPPSGKSRAAARREAVHASSTS